MKVAGIREMRANMTTLLGGSEPVLVTRHGRIAGLFVPLDEPDRLPDDLRRELAGVLGRHFSGLLDARGVGEEEIQRDFDAHRGRRG